MKNEENTKIINSPFKKGGSMDNNNNIEVEGVEKIKKDTKQPIERDVSPIFKTENTDNKKDVEPILKDNVSFTDKLKDIFKNKNTFNPSEEEFLSNYESEQRIEQTQLEPTNEAVAVGVLLSMGIDFIITILSRFTFYENKPLTKKESKDISKSFEKAYPDIEISPKITFFTTLLFILGSRVDINKIKDKIESDE